MRCDVVGAPDRREGPVSVKVVSTG
jgi:hypothetical protein